MPYKISKTKSGKYRVSGQSGTRAKHTTKKKAVAQVRLMEIKEAGVVPDGGWAKK